MTALHYHRCEFGIGSLLTSVFGVLHYDYGLLGKPALAVIADPQSPDEVKTMVPVGLVRVHCILYCVRMHYDSISCNTHITEFFIPDRIV